MPIIFIPSHYYAYYSCLSYYFICIKETLLPYELMFLAIIAGFGMEQWEDTEFLWVFIVGNEGVNWQLELVY